MTIKTNLLIILALTAPTAVYCAHMSNQNLQAHYDADLEQALQASQLDHDLYLATAASLNDVEKKSNAHTQATEPNVDSATQAKFVVHMDDAEFEAELQQALEQNKQEYIAREKVKRAQIELMNLVEWSGASASILPKLQELIAMKANVNNADAGYSPLWRAAGTYNRTHVIQSLIDLKADVNYRHPISGTTPLMHFCSFWNAQYQLDGLKALLSSPDHNLAAQDPSNRTIYDRLKQHSAHPAIIQEIDNYRRNIRDKKRDAGQGIIKGCFVSLCPGNVPAVEIIYDYYEEDPYPLWQEHPLPEESLEAGRRAYPKVAQKDTPPAQGTVSLYKKIARFPKREESKRDSEETD